MMRASLFIKRLCRFAYRRLDTLNTRLFKAKTIAMWVLWNKRRYSRALHESYGIQDIEPYNFRGWHNETSTFVGKRLDKRIFIKCNHSKDAIDNEVDNIRRLNQCGSKKLFETCEIVGTTKIGRQHIVIESFIEGVPLIDAVNKLTEEEISNTMAKLCDIVRFFHEIQFIHCDFTPGNVFLTRDAVYVIDFEFSSFVNDSTCNKRLLSLPNEKLRQLGGVYSLRNGTINDSYSLVQAINRHCPSFSITHKDLWISLNMNIDRLSITPADIKRRMKAKKRAES